jgi:ribosomal protein L7/L12
MEVMRDFLKYLEERFEEEREPIVPIYPYDKETNTISLPPKINKKLKRLILKGNKVEAVKQVTRLTGAGLRISKDYVDNLAKDQPPELKRRK